MTDINVSRSPGSFERSRLGPALPLIGVAGLRGKSTIVWLLERMIQAVGRTAGVWCTTGVYLDGVRQPGELGPWTAVLEAARAGEVDYAIQELESPVVAGIGLPPMIYPVAAITMLCGNDDDCLATDEAEQARRAQAIVARAVRPDGFLVLNADDFNVLEAAAHSSAETIQFALHRESPALRRHLDEGGLGVWLADNQVIVGTALDFRAVVPLDATPFTLAGALTFQVQNLLCAVGLAVALDLPDRAIRAGATAFTPDVDRLPGSCNIIQSGGVTVVIDTVRQVWTLRALVRGIRHHPHRRTIVVTDALPQLTDAQLTEAGRILGRLGGAAVLYGEDVHQTNLDRLIDGMAQNDVPPVILAMPGEHQAIDHALRMAAPGDLCLVVSPNPERVADAVRRALGDA